MSVFEQAIYETGLEPQSVFTNRGPIAKPPLELASGAAATILGFDSIGVPSPIASYLGKYITIVSALNSGTYRIKGVGVASVSVEASLSFPDPQSGAISWTIDDPRNGQIADDPADVSVIVNGLPVIPLAVVGLLGQIVLPAAPVHGDSVLVSYYHIENPRVYAARMNSKEFVMNSHGNDIPGGRSYRSWCLIVDPGEDIDADIQARLDQPLLRDLKYRAFERAYSALSNDPNLMVYNAPNHNVACPYLGRYVREEFVSYDPISLPEDQGWVRHGTGSAFVGGGTLTVNDNSGGNFGTGEEIFWTHPTDLSFDHVFALSWSGRAVATSQDSAFSGIVAGYSSDQTAVIIGYLEESGVKHVGVLLNSTAPQELASWSVGQVDWSVQHTYRIFVDQSAVNLYVDGSMTALVSVSLEDLPELAELNAPFDQLMGVFFGSVSYPAINQSVWDFVRYAVVPTSPLQVEPSLFHNYEGDTSPDKDGWAIIGSHGHERIDSSYLVGTSSSANQSGTGITDDFRGYVRLEPLASAATSLAVDFAAQVLRSTHGVDKDAISVSVCDGDRLMQVSLLSDRESPRISYGGRVLPTEVGWSSLGGQTAAMQGQRLEISDTNTGDGLVFYIDDLLPLADPSRVVSPLKDYVSESRLSVEEYTTDPGGFAGAMAQVYDGDRLVGWMLTEVAGIKYVALHSDGAIVSSTAFDWTGTHTFQIVKDQTGANVSLFVDGVLIATEPLASFTQILGSPDGIVSFGSATPASTLSKSKTLWHYSNTWSPVNSKKFLGLWNGGSTGSLLDFHLPLQVSGKNAAVNGNVISTGEDLSSVPVGSWLLIDHGSNQGVYEITGFPNSTSATIAASFPSQPSIVSYRIPQETDWTVMSEYRLLRSIDRLAVSVNGTDVIATDYDSSTLPSADSGMPWVIASGIPSVSFGAFSNRHLSETVWDYVRYGITRAAVELVLAPHHMVMNQRNVMVSPEHLTTPIAHTHSDFWSSSTGKPPCTDPDLLDDPALVGHTRLNEGTPLVPQTQTLETYGWLTPTLAFNNAMNDPTALFDGEFTYNDTKYSIKYLVPDHVLYNDLEIHGQETGEPDLIAPADDCLIDLGTIHWTKEVCDVFTADAAPETDGWVRASDDDSHAVSSSFASVLTYGTDAIGTRTVYRKDMPLLDLPSLTSEVSFRMRILNDSSSGLGDSQVRLGISAPGMTLLLALVTSSNGFRYVLVKNPLNGEVLGGVQFNFLDNAYHTYRIKRVAESVVISVS